MKIILKKKSSILSVETFFFFENSLYRSRAGRHFYGTENDIWADLGPVGNTDCEKNGGKL